MRRNRYPKCPTCGHPLPSGPDPSLNRDEAREILRRLTLVELRLDSELRPQAFDGQADALDR